MTSSSFNNEIALNRINDIRMQHGFHAKSPAYLYEHGDSNVKELCQNLAWLSTGKTMKSTGLIAGIDKVGLDKIEFAKVNEAMLLSAIYGCSGIIDAVAKTKGVNPAQIAFPSSVTSYRKHLLSEICDRTFHCKIKGTESHWLEWSEKFMDKLTYTRNVEEVLNELIVVSNNVNIIDVEFLSGLILVKGFTPNQPSFQLIAEMNNATSDGYTLNRHKGLKECKSTLSSLVCGNHEAVNAVVRGFNHLLTKKERTSPPVLTFFGASGTGKTHIAQVASECFNHAFSSSYETLVLNMENYSDDKASLKLFGSGSQFTSSSLGDLTLEAIKNPRLIVVCDEIEKAHITVQQSFLTLLSSGKAVDSTSRQQVNFSECLFVFTSNLGQNHISIHDEEISFASLVGSDKTVSLSPEMQNRLTAGEVIGFKPLSAKELLTYSNVITERNAETEYKWPSYVPELLVKTLAGESTPRALNNQLNKLEAKIDDVVMSSVDFENLTKLPTVLIKPKMQLEGHHSMALVFPTTIKKLFDGATIPDGLSVSHYSTIMALIDDINNGKEFHSILIENIDNHLFDFNELKALSESKNITINTFSKKEEALMLTVEPESHYVLSDANQTGLLNLVIKIALKSELMTLLPEQLKRKCKTLFDVKVSSQSMSQLTVSIENFETITPKTIEDVDCDFISFISDVEQNFDDVFGQTEAKKKLKEVTQYLKNKTKIELELPKGYILTGRPGTGKTLLAKAMAGECNMDFISVDAGSLLTADGVGKVNKVFEIAKKYSPSIIFIDEIELLLENRSKSSVTQHLVTNALLTNLDGISTNDSQVFVLGATNFTSNLDPAACRSGRFEERIRCYLPHVSEISSVLPTMLNKYDITISNDETLFIAEQLSGESFATINKVLRNTLLFTQNDDEGLSIVNVLLSQIEEHRFGKKIPERDAQLQQITAYHEAGHLLATLINFPTSSVISASIEKREKSSGYCNISHPTDVFRDWKTINNHLQTLFAGRIAEGIFLGGPENITTGCRNDIESATDIAKKAIINLGYSSSGVADLSQFSDYSSDNEVREWLGKAEEEVKELLTENIELLHLYAELLLEKKHIYSHDIINLWEEYNNTRKGCIAA